MQLDIQYSTSVKEPVEFKEITGEQADYPDIYRKHISIDVIHDGDNIPTRFLNNGKNEIDPEKALKDFKVFTFSCRSGLTKKAPIGWDITNETNLGILEEVINKEFSIDDMIDSVS